MKKVYSLLHNPDVQGAITIAVIVATIVVAFILTLGK
jgi:ABC-type sulfate transport system permease subunit